MARHAAQDEEIGQRIDHIDGLELAGDPDRQAFVGELVDHVEHAILPSIMGAVLDKVVGPDVIAVLGSQPDARSVLQPQPAAFGLFMGTFVPRVAQIRSTRLSLTSQPACSSNPVILR